MLDLGLVIANGTKQALVLVMRDKCLKATQAQIGPLSDALKKIVVAGYDEVVADLKAATDANMGEEMYKAILNAACTLFAINSLKAAGILQ